MNIWQIGFVVRSGVSALMIAYLLGYAAHYQWGISRVAIRTDALLAALLICVLVAIDFFTGNRTSLTSSCPETIAKPHGRLSRAMQSGRPQVKSTLTAFVFPDF
jgi:hypothetical protein